MPNTLKRVFLSYGTEDALDVARWLSVALTARGYQVFWDKEGLREATGTAWDRHIEEAISSHDVFVALMSPHSVRADGECRNEISFAKDRKKPIVPVMVRRCERPLRVHDLQYIDFEAFPRVGEAERGAWVDEIVRFIENGVPVDPSLAELRRLFRPLDYERVLFRKPNDPFVGREWLFNRIDQWLADPNAPSTLFVVGGPGVGKTSAMANWCRMRLKVGANHFCDHTQPDTAREVVASLAGQLLSLKALHPSYPDALRELDTAGREVGDIGSGVRNWTAVEWFRKLVLDPLRHHPPETPWVMVIDALDEAIPEVQNMYSVCHKELPEGVRLLITSRPDWNMIPWFRNPIVIDATSNENLGDLKSYATQRIRMLTSNTTEVSDKFILHLLNASDGSFLYCSEVLNSVEHGEVQISDAPMLPAGHSGVYTTYLNRCFPNISPEQKKKIRALFQTVLAAKELLDNRTLAELTGVALDDVDEARRSLHSLLSDGEYWRFFHKSFEDWLKTDRNNPYAVNLISGHETIINKLRNGDGINEILSQYRLRWLAAHLIDVARGTKDESHLKSACEMLTKFSELKLRVKMVAQTPSGIDGSINSIGEILRDLEALTSEADRQFWLLPQEVRMWQGLFLRYRELWHRYPEEFHQDCVNLFSQNSESAIPRIESRPWLKVLNQEAIDHQNHWKFLFRDSSCASFSPSEDIVALGGTDGALRMVETVTGALRWYKKVHVSTIHTVAISPDGKRVLTASDDNMVCLWATDKAEVISYLRDHNASIVKATFSADGCFVMTSSEDSEIRIWKASDGQPFRNYIDRSYVVGASNISSDGQMLVTVLDNHVVRILKVETGEVLKDLEGHKDKVVTALFSPDDSHVLTYSQVTDESASKVGDNTARVWNVETGDEFRKFDHDHPVICAAFSLDGTKVVTASERSIDVWSVANGNLVKTLSGHTNDVTYVDFNSDSTLVISVAMDRTVRIWDIANEELINTFRGHWGETTRCDTSHDSSLVLSTSNDVTRIWDMNRQTSKSVMHDEQIKFVNVSPGGTHVLSASDDGVVKIWDANDISLVSTIKATGVPFKSVIFSPCGRRILTASIDKTVSVWDKATGEENCSAGKLDCSIKAAVYSPCGSTFLTLHNEVVQVWDADCNLVAIIGYYDEFDDFGEFVTASYSPDGRMIVTTSTDCTSKVWCTLSGALKGTFEHDEDVTSASFASDNRHLITTSADCTAKLWDFDTRTLLHTFDHDQAVKCASFSPDGEFVVTLTGNKLATIWDCTDGTKVEVMRDCFRIDSVLDPEGVLLAITQNNKGSSPPHWKQEQVLFRWKDGFRIRKNDHTQCQKHPTLLNIDHNNGYSLIVRGPKADTRVMTHLETSSLAGCAVILPNDPRSFVVGSYDGTVRFIRLEAGVMIS
jgi:WD40 repeat protein